MPRKNGSDRVIDCSRALQHCGNTRALRNDLRASFAVIESARAFVTVRARALSVTLRARALFVTIRARVFFVMVRARAFFVTVRARALFATIGTVRVTCFAICTYRQTISYLPL
jgi:hypothetical protein